jgi:hypothetical protein
MDHGVKYQLSDSDHARFWRKVSVNSDTGCWEWNVKSKDKDGYGLFQIKDRAIRAHRVAWQMYAGAWPWAMQVCHRCDNPKCVRKEHLFLGTNDDNHRDKAEKRRSLHGVRNPKAKLTPEQVLAIRAAVDSNKECAAKYGVTKENIYHIRTGRTWKHV